MTLSFDMDRRHCDLVVLVDVAQAIGKTSESHAHCVASKANAARVESAVRFFLRASYAAAMLRQHAVLFNYLQ